MTTVTILETILSAKTRTELFGSGTESHKKTTYHKLARQSHPDMFSHSSEKELATKAFVHLTALWESSSTQTQAKTKSSYVQTRKNRYSFDEKIYEDDIFVAYNASYDGGHQKCQLWVSKSPEDNDIAMNAVTSLKTLNKDVPDEFQAFFPTFIERFRYRQDNIDRVAFAYSTPDGFYSLREVLEAYPQGIDGRDVAWMFKRMLVAIGNTYDAGIIHGGIGLDAFMIHPSHHGLILRNWGYSVEAGNALTIIDGKNRENYPESVFKKEAQTYRLDVSMAALLAKKLLNDKAPKQLGIFFKGCQVSSLPHPRDLLKEFDELLGRVYGEPKFHKFTMPND